LLSGFSREFDQPPGPPAEAQVSDFYPTVPAAFEALTEMKQVDKVLADIKAAGAAIRRWRSQVLMRFWKRFGGRPRVLGRRLAWRW
jgi:hypothetical protein